MGRQFDRQHATTVVLTSTVLPSRFVSFGGAYASGAAGAGGLTDMQGVSEVGGDAGDAIAVITGYSAPVEAGAAIAIGDFVKPGTDGKAIVGAIDDHCGRAAGEASGDGVIFEVILTPHVHP